MRDMVAVEVGLAEESSAVMAAGLIVSGGNGVVRLR